MRARIPMAWGVVSAFGVSFSQPAGAQIACDSLPSPVYLQVGDTQQPLMKALGRKLRDEERPITLVYVATGSCTNVEAIYTDVPLTTSGLYMPSSAEDPGWTTDQAPLSCSMSSAGQEVQLANSATFVSSCDSSDPPPNGVKLFSGPVQAYGFAVPKASSERAITAEEAYFAFGFGNEGMAAPWTDEAFMYIRTITKSTLLTMAAAIAVPASAWRGQRLDKSSEVEAALLAATDADKAIGILGVELFDQHRDSLKLLAFRAFEQRYAYFPDSTSTAFDKQNVRDGHYVPWAPTVWMTKSNADGRPVFADAGYVIDLILGNQTMPTPSFEPLDLVIDVGLIPNCAMQVQRDYEGGPLSLYEPDEPCGCYFEAHVNGGRAPARCAACADDSSCAEGVCRHGFCEVR